MDNHRSTYSEKEAGNAQWAEQFAEDFDNIMEKSMLEIKVLVRQDRSQEALSELCCFTASVSAAAFQWPQFMKSLANKNYIGQIQNAFSLILTSINVKPKSFSLSVSAYLNITVTISWDVP